MFFLIGEMLLYLGLAAAIGAAAGFFLRGALGHRALEVLYEEEFAQVRASAAAEIEAAALDHAASLAELKAQAYAAESTGTAERAALSQKLNQAETSLAARLRNAEAEAARASGEAAQLRMTLSAADRDWRARLASLDTERTQLSARLAASERATLEVRAEGAALAAQLQTVIAAREKEIAAFGLRLAEAEAAAKSAAATAMAEAGDDFKKISGLGPVAEKKLKALGVSTYAALAALDGDRIAEIERALGRGFSGKFMREGWAVQAAALAAKSGG